MSAISKSFYQCKYLSSLIHQFRTQIQKKDQPVLLTKSLSLTLLEKVLMNLFAKMTTKQAGVTDDTLQSANLNFM